MELCKETLADFIEKRNNSLTISNEEYLKTFEIEILKIMTSICKGLDMIHTRENLIHRDIKPNNIFFSLEGKIKIGDFGLATTDILQSVTSTSSTPKNNNLGFNEDYKLEPSKEKGKATKNQVFTFEKFHTTNIGTIEYTSPEQLMRNDYDQKVFFFLFRQIFSLWD